MKRCFSSLDVFKTPVNLTFLKQEKHSTYFGIVLSLGLIVLLGSLFFDSDVFYKQTPRVESLDIIQDSRPEINFRNRILTFAIEDEFANGFVDPSMFEIQVTNMFTKIIDAKNYFYLKNETKSLKVCQESDFPPGVYLHKGFQNNFCLNDLSFITKGFWDETYFTYMKIDVKYCDNTTFGGRCKPFSEIQKFLQSKSFNVYYSSVTVDTSNYKNPISSLISNDFYQIDTKLRKNLYLFLKNIRIETDDAWVFNNHKIEENIIFDSKELDHFFVDNAMDNNNPLFSCFFYSSRKTLKIKRVYQKLDEAFANLGGMANILMLVGFLLSAMEKSFDLKKKVMNSLYSFQDMKQIEKRRSLIQRKSQIQQIPSINEEKKAEQLSRNNFETPILNPIIELKQENLEIDSTQRNLNKDDTDNSKFIQKKEVEFGEILQNMEILNENSIISPNLMRPKVIKFLTVENLEINPPNENEIKLEKNNAKNVSIPVEANSEKQIRKKTIKNSISSSSSIQKSKSKKKKVENVEKFEEFMKEKTPILSFTFWEYFLLLIKRIFGRKLSDKEKLFLKGVESYREEIDLVSILTKLQELEKMKFILFSKEQASLFNLLDKPLIYLENNEIESNQNLMENKKFSKLVHHPSVYHQSEFEIKRAYEHFDNLEKNGQLTEIDKRLVSLVDEKVVKFIKNFS